MLPRLFAYSCAVSAFPAELSPSLSLPPGNPQILSHRVFNSWAVPAFPAGYSPSHAHRQGIRKSFPAAFSARGPRLLFPLNCHRVMAHRRETAIPFPSRFQLVSRICFSTGFSSSHGPPSRNPQILFQRVFNSWAAPAFSTEFSPSPGLPPGNPQILFHRVFSSCTVLAFPTELSPSHGPPPRC